MDHLRCVVERITYQNAENGFAVIKCRARDYADLVSVVGVMPDVHVGSVLSLGGSWKMDAKYGRQFSVETFEETLPATVFGIEKYLGSGLIKGVGPKYAKKIVNMFGKDTLEVIETRPDDLLKIPGIGKTRVDRIKASWNEQKEIKNIMLFLQSHDVSTSQATRIYKTYGSESIKIMQENPYRLADDVWGIGFKTADQIAEKMGFGHEKYARLRSGIVYTLNKLSEEGHCYATRDQLMETGAELLGVDDSLLTMTLDEMIKQRDVIREKIPPEENAGSVPMQRRSADIPPASPRTPAGKVTEHAASMRTHSVRRGCDATGTAPYPSLDPSQIGQVAEGSVPYRTSTPNSASLYWQMQNEKAAAKPATGEAIYLPPFYFSEAGCAKRLRAIFQNKQGFRVSTQNLPEKIAKRTGMQYDEIQMQAILTAVNSKILILTGGPGTGKTTTTLGILTAFRDAGASILLAAPTGRAAKRLSETTGMEAKTIHRLLEVKPPEGYQKNEENPLKGDVLIVDECSMIDIMLMYNLLKAVPDTMRVIFVGDIDQLPSVGAGNVLRDMMDSGCFPVVRLTRIFRQAEKSRIILNAHRINAGELPDMSNGRTADFFFMTEEDPDRAAATIVDLVKTKLARYYRTPSSEIQVLTPMQRGVVGAANMNQLLQKAINPEGYELKRGGISYREGDKVMQIRNNYDKEVFNGDIGVISHVNVIDKELSVSFDGRDVNYDSTELDELVLAYATTIHKAQGSEYPIVVMPIMMTHYIMLQRNLLYTGITRARKIIVLVGQKKAVACAVHNVTVNDRNTRLASRIRDLMR
ncbi:MAG: AAA family ATPase [Lachnospiraceae bacterium]|nr:AAA family ATPase [Lachnospiraceae bacterium]